MIAGFAVVAMLPAYWLGLPSGNDQSQHYQFAWTVYNAVKSGDVYPSFAPDTIRGFGDYGIRFYPPATYYVLAGMRAVTGEWYFASMAALTLVFFGGAFGIYLWTRELFDERTALIAAALYTFLPYHLNEIYNNFLLAEFFATAVLPWCFFYLHRTLREPVARNVAGLTIATSLLVLTHLPLTLIGGAAMALYALCSLRKEILVRQIGSVVVTGLITAALTAFYLSRWIGELAWITHDSDKYFSTTWDYRTNFLLVPSHWTRLGEDVLNLWFADLMLLAAILVAVPMLIVAIRESELRRKLLPGIVVFVSAVLLTTPLTKALWDIVTPLQKVQFPWRWLAVLSVFAALLGAAGITHVFEAAAERTNRLLPALIAVALAFVAFMGVLIIRTPVYVSPSQLAAEIATFGDSTGCDCWWPVWANTAALAQKEKVVMPGREVQIKTWSPFERSFVVAPGTATAATIKTWYYPRWQAEVNGLPVELRPDANGALSINIPPDSSDVSVRFVEPATARIAAVISLLAWLAVLFSAFALLVKSRGGKPSKLEP
ncbi:MAG: 6-pyruvoyl-tetrahydropterin synthase-related protein [Pyrinomonadaceae bacterium]